MANEGGTPKKKAVVPPAKRTGDTPAKKKVTVSQATIDQIKKQGMTAALKKAAAGGVSASYMEGVKRMYGAARLAKATSSRIGSDSTKRTMGTPFGQAGGSSAKPTAKRTRTGTPAGSSKPTPKPTPKKKSGTTDPFARFVFGVGKAAAQPFKSQPKK
jgi:hypothetical protein